MDLGRLCSEGMDFLKRQKQPFKINMLRVSFQSFLIALLVYYQSIYLTVLGATPTQVGLAIGIGGAAGAVVAFPAGWLADRYGVKKMLLLGTLVMTLGAIVLALASNWITAIPGLFMNTLGFVLTDTVCPLVCGGCLSNKERGTGMQLCDTISTIPRLLAPILGAILVTWFGGMVIRGIRPLYYLQFAGFVLLLAFTYSKFSNPIKTNSENKLDLRSHLDEIFRRGRMVRRWIIYRALSSFGFIIGFQAGFVPLYANLVKHSNQEVLGIMGSTFMVVPIILSVLIGKLADTFGRKRILYITIPAYCLSMAILILAQDVKTLILSSLFQGFLLVNLTNEETMTIELVPVNFLGTWCGLLALTRGVTSIVAPIIAGQIWDLLGPSSVFLFVICVELALVPLLLTMPETLNR